VLPQEKKDDQKTMDTVLLKAVLFEGRNEAS